jgi:sugar (pentulose or hexulose) kinase
MSEPLRCVPPGSLISGWDFSTGGVKALAFDLNGNTVAQVQLPTELWNDNTPPRTPNRISELNLYQLEGQAAASVRALAAELDKAGGLDAWICGGVSATHHTSGRIDANRLMVRRAICWNDESLHAYQKRGLARLGEEDEGHQPRICSLIGGPWAVRYSLSHLVKDEEMLSRSDWERTWKILPHGSLAAGYLTGNFGTASVSAAASTGIMDLRTCRWEPAMLAALRDEELRKRAWSQLPRIVDMNATLGRVSLPMGRRSGPGPWVYPTSDDQQAGLVGGGAVRPGQLAIILGNSAVVNSSSANLPTRGTLDVMRLNWGPYLWMRCYSNGAQFIDDVVGKDPDWAALEEAARNVSPGCNGTTVMPFARSEPCLRILEPRLTWSPAEPRDAGVRYRAALEALAYLIALAVREHSQAGPPIVQAAVSGGGAKSQLMLEILASALNMPLKPLVSSEGPALGAAVTALAACETNLRRRAGVAEPYTMADAVLEMVHYRDDVPPRGEWVPLYRSGLSDFEQRLAACR